MNSADTELDSLRSEYDRLIDSSSLDGEDALKLASRCRELIFHVCQRIEYSESRRGQMAVISLSFLATAVALFGFSFWQGLDIGSAVWPVRSAAAFLFFTGAITLVLYALQTNFPYPFIGITKTWRWFYHYSVSKEYGPGFFPLEGAERRKKMQMLHLTDMLAYAEKTLASSPKQELRQDLEQLFLVIVNEKYKNAQLTHLRKVIFYGLLLVIATMIVAAIMAWAS